MAEVPAAAEDLAFEGHAPVGSLEVTLDEEADDLAGSELPVELVDQDLLGFDATFGPGSTQLNPALGPVDLGWPLLVDLGAGEFPYDDGVRPIHGEEPARSGFSESLIQASWREPVTTSSKFHATVAMTRFQDLGLIDGAPDMRFAWFVVGFSFYF